MRGGSGGFRTSQVSVDTTTGGVKIAAALAGRQAVIVTSLGSSAQDVFVGNKGVATNTGALLLNTKGSSITIETNDEVWAIVGASTQTVSVLEIY